MQLLSDVIDNAKKRAAESKESDYQVFGDPAWEKEKDDIDALSRNTGEVIQNYLRLGNKYVKTEAVGRHHKGEKVCGDSKRITVKIASLHGKPVEMVAYECSSCGVFHSYYAIFDNAHNRCYTRTIVKE